MLMVWVSEETGMTIMNKFIEITANVLLLILFFLSIILIIVDLFTMKFKWAKGVNKLVNRIKKYISDNKTLIDILIIISIALSAVSVLAKNMNISINYW